MSIQEKYSITYALKQQNFRKNRICGDLFSLKESSLSSDDLFRLVLCDGMGHGIKANILSNVTMPSLLEFDFKNEDVSILANRLLMIQPVCSLRKINHCTYTVLDIDRKNGMLYITNYDNPTPVIFFNNNLYRATWREEIIEAYSPRPKKVSFLEIPLSDNMTIAIFSDGVTQSGTGRLYPFGWGLENIIGYILKRIENTPSIIATDIVMQAIQNDGGLTSDDVSCAIVKIRE